MSFLALVPLLPLLTAFIVMTGDRADQERNARAGLFPIAASFFGSLIILMTVTSEGPIMFQLYDPAAVAQAIEQGVVRIRIRPNARSFRLQLRGLHGYI